MLPFHFVDGFLWCAETFYFDVVSPTFFFFSFIVLLLVSNTTNLYQCVGGIVVSIAAFQKIFAKINIKELILSVFFWECFGFRCYV